MTGGIDRRKRKSGLGGSNRNKKDNTNLTDKKDLQIKDRNKNKDPELEKLFKKYPVNFSNPTHNKIFISLNNKNRLEGARRDCEVEEIYSELKFEMDRIYSNIAHEVGSDARFLASMILGMVNRFVTEYADKAKQSNHLGQMEETFQILNDFAYNLKFYKDGVIPLVLYKMNPTLFLVSQGQEEKEKEVIVE